MSNFFQFIIYGHTMRKAKTQPTDQVLPPVLQHCLANIMGRGGYIFVVSFLVHYIFYNFFHSHVAIIFHLNSYCPNMGTTKTQPTDCVLSPVLHSHLANSNGQQRVYFEG